MIFLKKVFLGMTLLAVLLVSGCVFDSPNLDLENLGVKLDNLETEEFARMEAASLLDANNSELQFVYDFDFEELFGLNSANIEAYSIAKSSDNTSMYFIVLPVEGKEKEVKGEIDSYIGTLSDEVKNKLSYEKYQNHLIYIIDDNSKKLLEEVKSCRTKVFTNIEAGDEETLTSRYGIDKDTVEDFLIRTPSMNVYASGYVIIKPVNGKKAEIKRKMNEYLEKLDQTWSTYLPDRYEMVKNRYVKEYGDYLIYIISSDNDLVYKTIKNNKM